MAIRSGSCDCCADGVPHPHLHNAPGLPALDYTVSTYAGFLRRMLARLSREAVEDAPDVLRHPLAALATREPDDPAIALLDSWAIVGHVLTFYQERIANEGFLRTATERRSVAELAALIGYRLNPGVAASAHLAFDVDDAIGAPASALVPRGIRVQSVPGQGELPQTFETSEAITARAAWNALRPRQLRPQELAVSGGKLLMLGISVGLGEGADAVDVSGVHPLDQSLPMPASGSVSAAEVNAVYLAGTNTGLKAGDVVLLVGKQNAAGAKEQTLPRIVRAVEAQDARDRTRVEFEGVQPRRLGYGVKLNQAARMSVQALGLDSSSANALANSTVSEQSLGAFGAAQGWGLSSLVAYYYRTFTLIDHRVKLPSAAPGLFALRARLGFFGHNAPALVPGTGSTGMQAQDLSSKSIWRSGDADCCLERVVTGISDNSWLVLELKKQLTAFRVTTTNEASLAEFGLSGRTTGLVLDSGSDKDGKFVVRQTTAHVQSERLVLAQVPIDAEIGRGTAEEFQLSLDRMVLKLRPGQRVAITGERDDLPGVVASEIATLQEVQHSGGFTTLFFASPGLRFRYVRTTVTLNANVVQATHGETVAEVLGSGDGSRPYQRFTLKRPPLTYTAASSESGISSSLQLRVNGLLWEEADGLFPAGPTSERFVVQMANDGSVSVQFGDGEHGARLPTGAENVTATYRSGIGAAGMVGANRITLMTMRPLGIRGVGNPLPASGAADPEDADSARANAPLTVLAMGRIVSLRDAADFARAFAGIGKAHATALWRGGTQWVHLTVAAGVPAPLDVEATTALPDYRIDLTSALGRNLAAAIDSCREPSMHVRLDSYQPIYFDLRAKVAIDDRFEWDAVETALRRALIGAFSFEARRFAQAVSLAEVVRVLHAVPGVVFVDIDTLRRFDQSAPDLPPDGVLGAGDVVWADADLEPSALAQLLIINPFGIVLTRA
ncbi:MAG TPA: putative baseplate assembly protein [Vicinamibacterales bacterium]|nr:putative baseplate assembly protein [Vicinamibacterales bacterium]